MSADADEVVRILNTIKPLLAGHEANVQGAVIADLLAMWLAGHAPPVREKLLEFHIGQVRDLVEINEKMIFGEAGHPGGPGRMWIGSSHRNVNRCLACGVEHSLASAVHSDSSDDAGPKPGDVTVCSACGHVMAFDDALSFRELTDAEIRLLAGDERLLMIQTARGDPGGQN